MKLFKNFIIPFILAIIVFVPHPVSASKKYSVTYSANVPDSKIEYTCEQLLINENLDLSNKRVFVGFYSDTYAFVIIFDSDIERVMTTDSYEVEFSRRVYYNYVNISTLSSYSPTFYPDTGSDYRGYQFPLKSGGRYIARLVQLSDGRYAVFGSQSFNNGFVVDFTSLSFNAPSSTPLGIDTQGFSEWLEQNPEFKDFIVNNAPWLDLTSAESLKFLLDYYNNYGMYSDSFMLNHSLLNDITIDGSTLPTVQQYDILRNMLKQQYNKYVLSNQPPIVGPTYPPYTNNNPVTIPDDTLTQPIVIQNNNEFNYYYLREIVRLITNDINNDYSYHYENKNILNNIVSGINDLNFTLNTNILPIVTGIANLDANLNLLVPVINSVNDNLTNLITPITNMGDKLNDISLKLDSGGSGNCNYDESFWELMLVPTFDEFDEIHAEFISKFPIVNEIATISLDGDIPTIENKLPDKELDNLIEVGLVPVAYASQGGLPSGQNPYGFNYSESEITSSDLFTFTMPTGTNSWLDKFNGMEISFINFKKFNTAIQFFKGIISVLAVFAFTKWLLNFVPKLATGASTGDG